MKTNTDIEQELKELSPTLLKLKQNGQLHFKVPENYFDEFKSEIFASIELGFSNQIGKNAFNVPVNYFAGLSDKIMDSIEIDEHKEVEKMPNRGRIVELRSNRKRQKSNPFKMYAMVAAVVGLFIFMSYLGKVITNPINDNSQSTFSEAAMEYIDENLEYFESEELYALIDLSDISIDLSLSEEFKLEIGDYINGNIEDFDIELISKEI